MPFKILPETPKPNSLNAESIHRLPAQAIKRASTSAIGLPGDVLSLPYAGINKVVSSLGGENVPYEQSYLGKALPTSETLTKGLERDIPYLKPKNKVEEFVGEVIGDATSLFIPSGALTKAGLRGTSTLKSFATSLGANSAGDFVSDLTGDPQKGAYTKMGTMSLLSAMNKPKAQKEIGELYKKADSLLPKDAVVSAKNLEKDLTGLQNRVLAGRTAQDLAPSEKFVIDEADKILRQIDLGEVNVNTLKAGLRSLNENLLKAVYEAPDKGTRTRARKLATQINRSVNSTLAEYGQQNPEWYQAHKGASDAFGALAQSNFLPNYIKNNLKDIPLSPVLLKALGVAGSAAGGFVPYQTAKILYRVSKSPELAKHYARVLSSASAENAPLMRKELVKLDNELKKEESKKSRFKLLD